MTPHARALGALLAVLILAPLPAFGVTAQEEAAAACMGPKAWFLGVVHDDALRDDFQKDVDNFEWYLNELEKVYCIGDTRSEILAFEDNYERNGKTYDRASIPNVNDRMANFGTAASAEADATLFFFLSSHGLVYVSRTDCDAGIRFGGSFSALSGGTFDDCDLGRLLNTHVADHVKVATIVDCSFCGGFSDSATALSGLGVQSEIATPSGILGPNRIAITGCAMTTECFGGNDGGRFYGLLRKAWTFGPTQVSRWSSPGFPAVQGIDVATPLQPAEASATLSELFFFTVHITYVSSLDPIAMQQQYRIKYGFDSLDDDIRVK